MTGEAAGRMVDVAFALGAAPGSALPLAYRHALARELEAALPWLAEAAVGCPRSGIHRLSLSTGAGAGALVSRRTRLVVRVPRERAADALALQGRELPFEGCRLAVGPGQVRELLPWGTLYAHFVAGAEADEAAFLRGVRAQMDGLQVPGRAICGRAQALEGGRLHGFSLMVDGLSGDQALRLMDAGLGAHRRLGCGLFVPHKSAAAVGAPP